MSKMKDFEDFNMKFGAIEHPTGDFGTFKFDVSDMELVRQYSENDPNRVWTLVDYDEERTLEILVPSIRLVDRLAYFVTKVPRVPGEEYENYLYWDVDNECSTDEHGDDDE